MSTLAASSSPEQIIQGIGIWGAIIMAYWVPTIVAWRRKVANTGSVAVVNGLLGWTFVGWVVALAMACRSKSIATHVTQ